MQGHSLPLPQKFDQAAAHPPTPPSIHGADRRLPRAAKAFKSPQTAHLLSAAAFPPIYKTLNTSGERNHIQNLKGKEFETFYNSNPCDT